MSRSFFIAPIVEGHGEVQAVPILLKRLMAGVTPDARLRLNPALRVKAGSFVNDDDYFNKYVELAALKAKPWPNSCVLILLDCEDDCPGELGPKLLERERRPVVRMLRLSSYWHIGNMRRGFSRQPDHSGEFVVSRLILILRMILNCIATPDHSGEFVVSRLILI